jgi:hypothetical protein
MRRPLYPRVMINEEKAVWAPNRSEYFRKKKSPLHLRGIEP